MSSMIGYRNPYGASAGQKISGHKVAPVAQYTPEQVQLFQSLFGHLGPESYTSRLAQGDQSFFEQMEAPALRQFSGLQGNIASRFSGQGGLGARRSSGFQNEMSSAASNFAQDLQGRRQDYQRQALRDLMAMSGELLGQRAFETTLGPKKKSFLQELFGGVSGGLSQGLGNLGSLYGASKLGLF